MESGLHFPRCIKMDGIIDLQLDISMGSHGLEPWAAVHIQHAAEPVHQHPDPDSALCCGKERCHDVLAGFIHIKIEGGEDDLLFGLVNEVQTVEEGVGVVVYVGGPLSAGKL